MIIDGRKLAEELYLELAEERKKNERGLRLRIVGVGENPFI